MNSSGHKAHPPANDVRAIRHTADVLNILIASPSDVTAERDVTEAAIHEWNATHFESFGILLRPVRWETHSYPASGQRTQAIINRQIVDSGDVLIGIFGYKLGTPTGAAQSGTIEEIEEFRKAGKYVALYFSNANVPRGADQAQLQALEAYKAERQKDTLYFEFEDASGLRDHLTRHLPKIVREVTEGTKANTTIVKESALQANERVADAEPALARYRSGRTLTKEQKKVIRDVLRPAPKGPVVIKPNFLSPEPTRYANALSELFNSVGFSDVGDKPLSVVSTSLPGMFVVVRDSKHLPRQFDAITRAFSAAKIPFTAHAEPYVPNLETVVILVGEQP